MFLKPGLGFNETWKPVFIVLLIASCIGSVAGIIYFLISRKSWPVIICFVISIVSILLNIRLCMEHRFGSFSYGGLT